jgi:peroxiredoxin
MTYQTPGTRIPDLQLTDFTGTTWSLSDYFGKKHVVLVLMRGLW